MVQAPCVREEDQWLRRGRANFEDIRAYVEAFKHPWKDKGPGNG
jgi:hypothetical protein